MRNHLKLEYMQANADLQEESSSQDIDVLNDEADKEYEASSQDEGSS